jgi:actin-like ATPase involved in cell morphogenesis
MTVFGVDLGATNIRAGYRRDSGDLAVVRDEDGADSIPAAVWFAGADEVHVGRPAAAQAAAHPAEVVTAVRAELLSGSSGAPGGRHDRYFHGRYESPEAVARYLYSYVARLAAEQTGEPAQDVLIGIPASAGRGAALRAAAQSAGLSVLNSLAEPVAVALHYGTIEDGTDHLTVICDLGGTSLDVSVLRNRGRNVEILHSSSEPVGGRSWDEALAEDLLAQVNLAHHAALADVAQYSALTAAAEGLRIELSGAPSASRRVRCGDVEAEVRLDTERMAHLTAHLTNRVVASVRASVEAAVAGAGEPPEALLLAGAASRTPGLARALSDGTGLEIRLADPEIAVVSGLTVAAGFGALWVTRAGAAPVPEERRETASGAQPRGDPDPPLVSQPAGPAPRARDPEPTERPAHPGGAAQATDPEPEGEPRPAAVAHPDADPGPATGPVPGGEAADGRAEQAGSPGPGRDDRQAAAAARPGPAREAGQPPAAGVREPAPAGTSGVYQPLADGGDVIQQATRLTTCPVDQLSYIRRGSHLQLTWIWPDESLTATVYWHCDGDPPGRNSTARCSRRVYEHDGGFVLTIGRGGATVTVEALLPGDDLDDRPPSALRIEPLVPVVTYEPAVRRGLRRWTVSVTFTSEADCELPPALLVLGIGSYRPTSTRDGEILREIPAGRLKAREPFVVSFETHPRRRPCWLVCLPADPDSPDADLQPAALHKLRIS